MKRHVGGSSGAGRHAGAIRLLVPLYVLEACAALLWLCLYKKADVPLGEFVNRPAGMALIASAGVGALALLRVLREATRVQSREIGLALKANLLSVAIALTCMELGLRLLVSVEEPFGLRIGSTTLVPRDWQEVAQAQIELLEEASATGSWAGAFLVPHPARGWTNGANRASRDGLSFSSAEGIRSPGPGVVYAGAKPARSVAIVGDSYTFGLEVGFADTWGAHLDDALGERIRVLNFGVDGYGIDQAYLRYRQEVVPWQPEIVILSFIDHDLERTLSVYPLLTFGWQMPFTKPRFTLGTDGLRVANAPLLVPEELFSIAGIDLLPQIDRDPGYDPDQWQRRIYHRSMIARYLVSRFPRWPIRDPELDRERMRLNVALLRRFVDEVQRNGSRPLIVYLPTAGAGDFTVIEDATSRPPNGRQVLFEAGLDFEDLTADVKRVPATERLVQSGHHYSPAANEAVARALLPVVRAILARDSG